MTATRRSCSAGTDGHRPRAERRHEPVDGSVAPGLGRRERCEEPRGAVEELHARAARPSRLRAADRMTADEPRVSPGRARRRTLFVEPASVTAHPAGADARTSRTAPGSEATGTATTATSASCSAAESDRAGSTAPRSAATVSVSGSSSQPATSENPARRAARPTEAPINPVPTTASRMLALRARRPASARRRGMRDRATAARSGADRRASRSGGRAAPRAPPRSRRDTRSRPRP